MRLPYVQHYLVHKPCLYLRNYSFLYVWNCSVPLLISQPSRHRWRDPIVLWGEAFRVNPKSCISGAELGMALSNGRKPRDAIKPLWELHANELASDWYTRTVQGEGRRREQKQQNLGNEEGQAREAIEIKGTDPRLPQWSRMVSLMNTR